ncbi:3',5'-cyclic adenosine monophosphate phosphodiesterase CpdA [Bradyrhizobium ivorense]|uniref:3',5'-cyclic adenosine monophosphate phosphodiesterase CpdA n=1 Tax=Bradyrhizobium ivorense TaxID=2511166 RepID=A0A508SSJ6_9BRAD|nr:metallophosphoesterase [Bradyrhizobium ivorense]VIO64956.1 3',5'-cyclic adenosine monophosphate phosphodiesterase CpdA [Bradyrhizobium ivorense]
MPTRIAHLSDLHYGGAFDLATWRAVEKAVESFDPDLIIVSGDLVDDPRRDHLLAAKKELEDLAARAKAELYVVPGNHDVFFSGVDLEGTRSGWYYETFGGVELPVGAIGGGQAAAGTAAQNVGFTRQGGRWQVIKDRISVLLGLGPHANPSPLAPPPAPDGAYASMLREPNKAGVLLALIDSNAADQPIRIATGSVSRDHLVALDAELTSLNARLEADSLAHFARIAVIHHHVLPIAYTAGGIIGAEPFMVLHNAGDVLGLLAKHQFDLVLHGHKHRAQFARIDLLPDSPEGYPIAIAAAGSAALLTPNNPTGNSFNLITIQDNGRIVVEALYYGAGSAPNRGGRKGEAVKAYTEGLDSTKRRAFMRACQRYPIYCHERIYHFEISELGDFTLHHHTVGLRALRQNGEYRKRPHSIRIPAFGQLARGLQLDAASRAAGYSIDPVEPGGSGRRRMVILPAKLESDRGANYTVSHTSSNSIVMTSWEADERARAEERGGVQRRGDWDQEGVGCFVSHPVNELHFKLSLPASLSEVRPYLRCDRLSGFPNFKINEWGDAELPDNPVFDIDTEMEDGEGRSPYYDPADKMWHLVIHRPVVGYRYRLRWQTPGLPPDQPIPGETLQWRELLLNMVDREVATDADNEAQRVFGLLADEFEKRLGWLGTGEYRTVELFVYDSRLVVLRPVARRSSHPLHDDWRKFQVPLGDGIAGAAFQRRSIVPWAEQDNEAIFIKPIPDPTLPVELRTILAVPIYHHGVQDDRQPSPSGAIGVISFGSSSPASKISTLLNRSLTPQDEEKLKILRGLAQSHVHKMITALGQPDLP